MRPFQIIVCRAQNLHSHCIEGITKIEIPIKHSYKQSNEDRKKRGVSQCYATLISIDSLFAFYRLIR